MPASDFEHDLAVVGGMEAVPRILEVVCGITGMGFAAIARVTPRRWVVLAVRDDIQFGLRPGGELKVQTTICHEVRQAGAPVVIEHVAEDEVYCGHPTPKMYGFQSFISVPIVLNDGQFYGTLCAIDPQPRKLGAPEILGMFKLFAEQIAFQVDAAGRLATSEASLSDARQTGRLREEFIAVLGHDLRNPLGSVAAGVTMLMARDSDAERLSILRLMMRSVRRMSGMVDNLLDFARGRLGDGIELERDASQHLEPALAQIVDELRGSHPDSVVETHLAITETVDCDHRRVGQVLSNLLGNALSHGESGKPIHVRARTADGSFSLSVSNAGDPIPLESMAGLFQPFTRGRGHHRGEGLGLGLFIAAEIARAHGGTLTAASTAAETRFTFTIPLSPGENGRRSG